MRSALVLLGVVVLGAAAGCGGSTDRDGADGGTGGATASGGAMASGGVTASGGATGETGGTDASGGGASDLDACAVFSDCTLTAAGCCGACEPIEAGSLVAVRADRLGEYQDRRGCGDVQCAACEMIPLSEWTGQNFYAACVDGSCVVRDVREQPFTECATAADCRLRCGSGCCTSCGSGEDLIALRNDTDERAVFCPGESVACVTCDCAYPETYAAECIGGRCAVARPSICTPGADQTCNADPMWSSIQGTCNPDGTCTCVDGSPTDPGSGLCH